MIRNHPTKDDLRDSFSIPHGSIVFGRYGGTDSFDIGFVHDAIRNVLNARDESLTSFT
jgi:hypothetical protein